MTPFLIINVFFFTIFRNVEHAYSVPHSSSPIGSADMALIVLQKSTKEFLEGLLMEGDLLEVSLDETQHMWRILNAAKSSSTDLNDINLRFKIMVRTTKTRIYSFINFPFLFFFSAAQSQRSSSQ